MNTKKFFTAGKEAGIEVLELTSITSEEISVELYHGEITSYKVSESNSVNARGIYKGKLGAASSTSQDEKGLDFLIEQVKVTALINEVEDKQEIFEGSPKYAKGNVYNKDLALTPMSIKIDLIRKIEKRLGEIDKRIVDVTEVDYSESTSTQIIENSYGLKLKSKSNYCYIAAAVKAQDGESIKTNYEEYFAPSLDEFDLESFCQLIVKGAVEKLNGKAPWDKTKCYAVLHPDVVGPLLDAFISSMSSDQVQRHSSLLEGKLKEQVISKRITIEEKPLIKNVFYRNFDDEGVATYNKKLINKGILETYLYNLQTAQKDGVTTTANGYRSGTNIGIGTGFIVLKPGRKSELEIISNDLRDGVYLTVVKGLHAGLNPESGNFSLESEGFLIRDGKIDKCLGTITVAGNLLKLFSDVVAVANNSKTKISGYSIPSIKVKKLSFSA